MTKDDKIKYTLEFLQILYNRRSNYHDHKEKMAWTASAIYYTFCFAVISWMLVNGKFISSHSFLFKLLVSLLFIAIGWFTFVFINMQFRMRWDAADEIVLIVRYIFLLLSNKKIPFTEFTNGSLKYDDSDSKRLYPIEIWKEHKALRKQRKIKIIFFLIHWIKYIRQDDKDKDDRLNSEIPSYAIMLILLIAKIIVLFNVAVCQCCK